MVGNIDEATKRAINLKMKNKLKKWNLCILTPNRSVWILKVKTIILSSNSDKIGVLIDDTVIATMVDIGVLRKLGLDD